MLLHLQQVQAIRRPTFRNQNSLFNMIWDNKLQVHEEMDWIYRREDLAALARDSEHGWFNGFVEDTLNTISRTMTAVSYLNFHVESFFEEILLCTTIIQVPFCNSPLFTLISPSSSSAIVSGERRQANSTSLSYPKSASRSSCEPRLSS